MNNIVGRAMGCVATHATQTTRWPSNLDPVIVPWPPKWLKTTNSCKDVPSAPASHFAEPDAGVQTPEPAIQAIAEPDLPTKSSPDLSPPPQSAPVAGGNNLDWE